MNADVGFIAVEGRRIATRIRQGSAPATLLFLPGYASDMDGYKALSLDAWAAERGVGMARFDYSGTGLSPGEFAHGTLDRWLAEALAVADVTDGPLIPIGSSMGGWIALHLALRRPDRVRGLLGIAAAPDFTDWGYDANDRRILDSAGRLERPNPYGGESDLTTLAFWQSGQRLKLLDEQVAIDCPVRLIHGTADEEVPLDIAERLLARLRSADVQLWTVKGGGHRLSAPHEIRTILRAAADLLELAA